ncbi:hypothetical protein BGZ54_002703, partial [Gamsiella multidivaricata]
WSAFTAKGNGIAWDLIRQMASPEETANTKLWDAEWGPDTNSATMNEAKDFLIPMG